VFIASEWNITETGGEVQVFWGIVFTSDGRQDEERILEWAKLAQ